MVPFRSHLAPKLTCTSHRLVSREKFGLGFGARLLFILILSIGLHATLPLQSQDETAESLINQWLAAQTNLQTWSAEVTQTRHLKTLAQPLVAHGRVWFSAPHHFRWEIGQPASTIAVRQPTQMLVIYPRLKRVEKFPLDDTTQGPWKEILALLEAGFPRTRGALEARFQIVGHDIQSNQCELALRPKSPAARHMMPHLRVAFSTDDFSLRATELEFADGSTMRNTFTNTVHNPALDPGLFQPELPANFEIVNPTQ